MSALHDATVQATAGTGTSLGPYNHSAGANVNFILINVSQDVNAGSIATPTVTIDGSSTGITLHKEAQHTDIGQFSRYTATFKKINPGASATLSIEVTGLNAAAVNKHCVSSTFTGVNTADPIIDAGADFGVGGSNDTAASSGAQTANADDLFYDVIAVNGGSVAATLVPNTGTVPTNGKSDAGMCLGVSYETGGSLTRGWTWTGSQDFEYSNYVVKGTVVNYKAFRLPNIRPNAFAPGLAR